MNTLKFSLLCIALVFSGCGKDLLEIDPSGSLPVDGAIASIDDIESVLLGAYSQFQNSDYYGRYFILVPDVMSDDVKQNSSANRAKEWAEFSGTPLDFISEEMWTEIYEAINRLNTVINAEVDFPTPEVQAEADQLIGEALALRALAHFDVCRIYAQHYAVSSGSDPGVPIVTAFDETAEPARSSVSEVYGAVIGDLQSAISKMNDDRGSGFMSKLAAQAILARVYFYMGDYSQAEQMANTVISAGDVTLADNSSYFDAWMGTGSAPDVLFEIVMTEADNNGSDALGRMYINEGYGDYLPSDDLRLIINEADVRSQLYKPDSTLGGGDFGWDRMNKFPSTTGEDNTPVIRLSEVYLIRAESRARNGNEAGAVEDLMAIRSRAWPDAPAVTATGDALLEEIITERRIELAFEGHRLWDLMRLNRGVVRSNCTAPVCEINFPNERFVLPIPAQELDANPNMVQNNGY
ncbi:MAG: RagB/SusD family nutrient uptake outer membrane protein [Saprospiraceae bacterium]|nr:RagB/SusD family nutrient uptake outer membrane protein [Saprospiraceae bacterium]